MSKYSVSALVSVLCYRIRLIFLSVPAFRSATEPEAEALKDNFESRREVIIANAEKDDSYEKNEYTEDDYQALRCLLPLMRGLMEHEPDKRLSAGEAVKSISWIDHWREVLPSEVEKSEEE